MQGAAKFLFVLLFLISSGCGRDDTPPQAIARAFPEIALPNTIIELNASDSYDNNTFPEGLYYSWDLESDGTWEAENLSDSIYLAKFALTGLYNVCLRVMDHDRLVGYDTVEISIITDKPQFGQLIDSRDGKVYKTVLIHGIWWMAENLDYGEWINSGIEQENNGIVEKYYYRDDSINYSYLGGLYSWDEAKRYLMYIRGICPEGWHIPDKDEALSLMEHMDKWYAWQYLGSAEISGLGLKNGAFAKREYSEIVWCDSISNCWTRDYDVRPYLNEVLPLALSYTTTWGDIGVNGINVLYDGSDGIYLIASNYAGIRCVRDEL